VVERKELKLYTEGSSDIHLALIVASVQIS
jgi:hypothetical protein